jgi:D-sedoheptulose 7-phosphate isomerase
MNFVINHLNETKEIINKLDVKQILKLISLVKLIKKKNGRIFFLGVGGSAANASHAVNDFRKLCNIESYAPTDNVSELSARVNDEGWNTVFAKWLEVSKLTSRDLLFIFSVGGGNKQKNVSVNIIEAIKYAKKKRTKIAGIVGRDGGYAYKNSDVAVLVPTVNKSSITPHCESFQTILWHLIISHPDLQENKTKW